MSLALAIFGTIAAGLLTYFGVAGTIEVLFYQRRRLQASEWKCQPNCFPALRLRRCEIMLGTFNRMHFLTASGLYAWRVGQGGFTQRYSSFTSQGVSYTVLASIGY